MSGEPFAQEPLPGLTLDGVTISQAIRLQGEARTVADDDDLRLDVDRFADEPRPPRSPSRTAIMTMWAVGLIAALGVAGYVQVSRQMTSAAAMDASPPPPEAAPAAPTGPVPPPAAGSQSAPIVAEAAPAPANATEAPPTAGEGSPPASEAAKADAPAQLAKAVAPADEAKTVTKAKADGSEVAKASSDSLKAKKTASATAKKTPTGKKPADDIAGLKTQLNHAYNQAVKAGTPPAVLKARRAEWTVLYAKAEKKSPEAVAKLYRTRTAQLEALAKRQHPAGRRTG